MGEAYITLSGGRRVRLGEAIPVVDETHLFTRNQMAPRIMASGPVPPAGVPRVAWGDVTIPTIEEKQMISPALPQFPGGVFSEFVNAMNRDIALSRRTPEQEFLALDVRVGDRVRLTQVTGSTATAQGRRVPKDAAVLEGTVLGIKQKGGSQLRITGFDHTGPSRSGGQHVWFAVSDYRVEVLHKVYRITDEDRLIAAVANVSEDRWAQLTDDQRATRRRDYADRAERVKRLLTPKPDFN